MYIRPNDDIQWGMKLRQFFRYQLRYDARANGKARSTTLSRVQVRRLSRMNSGSC